MNIKTENVCPPIPNRNFDWIAYDDDTYDGSPDSTTRNQTGSGATREAAIADLIEQLGGIETFLERVGCIHSATMMPPKPYIPIATLREVMEAESPTPAPWKWSHLMPGMPEDANPGLEEFLRDAKALKTRQRITWEAYLEDLVDGDGIIGTGDTELEAIKHLAEAYREQDEDSRGCVCDCKEKGMITCPFCGENDFDLVGLKGHLLNDCVVFHDTDTPVQELMRRRRESGRGA